MLSWIEPRFSNSRIKTAGKRIRENNYSLEDILVLENHRASHTYIMNTFNSNLRRRSRGQPIVVAQRLKRRNTIFDKLKREPNMQLSTMHDIAGIRLIFQDQHQLNMFRDRLHKAKFDYILRTRDDDRYIYILNPKDTGYRGIHDVYEYRVRSRQGEKWNGLLIEIQYPTKFQHAWATAVEAADFINTSQIKFDDADYHHKEFFRYASEIIARAYEQQNSCLTNLSSGEIVDQFRAIDRRVGLLRAFRNLQKAQSETRFRTTTILIFDFEKSGEHKSLRMETFDSVNRAISRYEALEKELAGRADIVLVRSDTPEAIRDAFRNYFSDVNEFLTYVDDGRAMLHSFCTHQSAAPSTTDIC